MRSLDQEIHEVHRSTRVIGNMSLIATGVLVVLLLALVVAPKSDRAHLLGVTFACQYHDGGALPDPKCTPGLIYRKVTQSNIHATICVKGWTATVRPPTNVTEPRKFASMRQYGDATVAGEAAKYEYDHLIPLELGGAPLDSRNLWPEQHSVTVSGKPLGSYVKDGVENVLNARVCSGKMTLAAARRAIRKDWTTAVTTP